MEGTCLGHKSTVSASVKDKLFCRIKLLEQMTSSLQA